MFYKWKVMISNEWLINEMLWMKHSNIDMWYIIYYYVIFNKQCKYSRKAINKMWKIENNHAIIYFHNFEGETIVILETLAT